MQPFIILVILLAAGTEAAAGTPARGADRRAAYHHYSLAVQARLQNDHETALAEYRRAEKLDPASAEIRVATARLLRDMGRAAEAIAEAKQAVALAPKDPDNREVLAQLYQAQAGSD